MMAIMMDYVGEVMGPTFHVKPYNTIPRRTRVATPMRLRGRESNGIEADTPLPSWQITVPIESFRLNGELLMR